MAGVRNLTQVEAAERARLLDVTGYDITLDLTDGAGNPGEQHLPLDHRGRRSPAPSRARRRSSRSPPSAVRSADAQRRRRSTLSGWSAEKGLTLTGLAAENTLVVDADFPYSASGQGLHRSVDPVDKEVYLYSQFETADAQRVFACFDQPDLKSVYTWHATVPAHWKVVSNMPVERDGAGRRRRQDRPLRPVGADEHLHHRALRRAVPRGARHATTASTWASSAGPRWRSTSTPTTCS